MTIKKRVERLESKLKQKTTLPKIPSDFVEFNKLIGLPRRKISPFDEMPIFDYELEMISNIQNNKYYALNKARCIGATEIILRLILHKAILNKIPARKFLIVAGTRSELARDHLRRIAALCKNIFHMIDVKISDDEIRINKSKT